MEIPNLLADITDWIWVLIPLAPFMVGGIAILVKHQQRMAEIVHGVHGHHVANQDVAGMQEQINQLRQQLAQVTLALDDIKRVEPAQEVRERITEVQS